MVGFLLSDRMFMYTAQRAEQATPKGWGLRYFREKWYIFFISGSSGAMATQHRENSR